MLAPNNTNPVHQQDGLAALAETIRREHSAVGHAAINMLAHAMAAGDALAAAKAKVTHGNWAQWLRRETDLSERTAQRYLQLAAARAQLDANPSRATDLSITGALRVLGNTPRPRSTTRAAKTARVLCSLAWRDATLAQRRHFLNAIGLASLLEALPPAWRAETRETAPALVSLSGKLH